MTRLVPPTPGLRLAFGAAVLFFAATLGFVAGTTAAAPNRPGAGSVDVAFLRDMITHHEQALQMSIIELQLGGEESVKVFAREILRAQSYEIGAMERQLEQWGYSPDNADAAATQMPGMASPQEMELLSARTGREVDALFVPLMQDHHRGGVHMASSASRKASNAFVRELASRMARNQRAEIGELGQARLRAGLPAAPQGYEPAAIPRDHGNH